MKSAPKNADNSLRPRRQRKPVTKYSDFSVYKPNEEDFDQDSDDDSMRKRYKSKPRKKTYGDYNLNEKGEFENPE